MNVKDLTNIKYGKLLAIKINSKSSNGNMWLCRCDCGNETIVLSSNLLKGHTSSCGCLRIEKITAINTKHNLRHSRLYSIWTDMKSRCNNPKKDMFYIYGGKGVEVCKEWEEDFKCFYDWAIMNGYNENLTIDRKDNNGGYCPSNCQWSTTLEQSRNRTVALSVTDGKNNYSIKELSNKYKISYHTLYRRLKKDGVLKLKGEVYYDMYVK